MAHPPPPKVCPECREEYLHTAERCVSCDVPLVYADQMVEVAPEDLPPVSELECIRAASVAWAIGLSEKLRDAGVAHRIEAVGGEGMGAARRPGHQLPYGVYVRREDAAAAAEIDARHLATEIPDLPVDFAAAADGDAEACPACGERLDPEAEECGSCGLALAAP